MKILHCILGFTMGGAEAMLVDIMNEQVKTDTVGLVVINDDYDDSLLARIDPSVEVILVRRRPGSRLPFKWFQFNDAIRRFRPDILHLHQNAISRVIFPWLKKGLWLTLHDLGINLRLRGDEHLIAISDSVAADVTSRYPFMAPNVVTILNGIPHTALARRPLRRFDKVFRIVQVARLRHLKKGQDILIEALAILRDRGFDDIYVDFIGEGPSLDFLAGLAAERGVADRVRFLGNRERDYVYSSLKDYDLMCHPARYEGFGLVIAEAMAAYLPVAVTDQGGPYEVIDHGQLGTVFAHDDAASCAEAISEVYRDYDRALGRLDEAAAYVEARYSIGHMVAAYRRAYLGALPS